MSIPPGIQESLLGREASEWFHGTGWGGLRQYLFHISHNRVERPQHIPKAFLHSLLEFPLERVSVREDKICICVRRQKHHVRLNQVGRGHTGLFAEMLREDAGLGIKLSDRLV